MSADNYILIRKEGGFYVGYYQSASADEPQYAHSMFVVGTIEDAIREAQGAYTEYGYRFEEFLPKESFCPTCGQLIED